MFKFIFDDVIETGIEKGIATVVLILELHCEIHSGFFDNFSNYFELNLLMKNNIVGTQSVVCSTVFHWFHKNKSFYLKDHTNVSGQLRLLFPTKQLFKFVNS